MENMEALGTAFGLHIDMSPNERNAVAPRCVPSLFVRMNTNLHWQLCALACVGRVPLRLAITSRQHYIASRIGLVLCHVSL
jgi:hypothetical protein